MRRTVLHCLKAISLKLRHCNFNFLPKDCNQHKAFCKLLVLKFNCNNYLDFFMPKIPKELEAAIKEMPEKEKDKLLLRLIRKDQLLIQQLHHQLLEDEADMELRREELDEKIRDWATRNYSDSPGWVMMEMRDISGMITRHVKITKDKYGDVALNLTMLKVYFDNYYHHTLVPQHYRADKFAQYVCKKLQTTLNKLYKLHEDLYIEFEDDVNKILDYIYKYKPTEMEANYLGLPEEFTY